MPFTVRFHIDDHPTRRDQWRTVRDCLEGEDAIKAGAETYLPRPSAMVPAVNPTGNAAYEAYKARACFYAVADRTRLMLEGMVNRVAPSTDAPDAFASVFDGTPGRGLSLLALQDKIVGELASVSRVGVLVDMEAAAKANNTPFLTVYHAEDIIETRWQDIDGTLQLTYVRLRECTDAENALERERYRDLILENGRYRQEVVTLDEEKDAAGKLTLVEHRQSVDVIVRGEGFGFIPFVLADLDRTAGKAAKPAMLDLCRMNLGHYRNSADYEHALFLTAQPTPWIAGADANDPNAPTTIGPGKIWFLPMNATTGLLEFTGAGVGAQQQAMQDKEDRMAILGAQLIRTGVTRNETAETARLRSKGETSVLAKVTACAEEALNQAYRFAARMLGIDPEAVFIRLNRDFIDAPMSGKDMLDHVKAWQSGALGGGETGHKVLLYNLRRGEVIPADTDDDEIVASAEAAGEQVEDVDTTENPGTDETDL